MKRITCVVLMLTAAAFSAFSLNGVVRELTGEVELKAAGSDVFTRASIGETVSLNTVVSTGFRSSAVIEVGSSMITVRPLTRLSLAEVQSIDNTENVNLNLQAGRVRVDVNPPAGTRTNFTVQSPSATASVRGTSFDFDMRNLTVDSGRVIFSGDVGSGVMVTSGGASFIGTNGLSIVPAEAITATLLPPVPVGVPAPEGVSGGGSSLGGGSMILLDINVGF